MPDLVSTHPNATVVMIGERAASLVHSHQEWKPAANQPEKDRASADQSAR
jgi:choline dehydrogenase-like flavoprotein